MLIWVIIFSLRFAILPPAPSEAYKILNDFTTEWEQLTASPRYILIVFHKED